jgi:hypothetical protein
VEIKQLSPAARRPGPSRTDSTATNDSFQLSQQHSPAVCHNQQLSEQNSSTSSVMGREERLDIRHVAAGGPLKIRQVGAAGMANNSFMIRTPSGGKISGRHSPQDQQGSTKIVFLGKDGNVLAESRLEPSSPPYWKRSRGDDRPPPLTASQSAESEDELVRELSCRLELWRSLNGSPTYPLPPYQTNGDTSASSGPLGYPNGQLLSNGGPGCLHRSDISPVVTASRTMSGRRTAAPLLSTRQSTDDSQQCDGIDDALRPVMMTGPGVAQTVNGKQQAVRPRLSRQSRISN